eukprot:TRINITY_DN4438_c0_g1_i2.p1 TRINITY_DN4438_c0_g1~~TRINITY_DN4438_c0_g1_i2.p1  ORF type:complete len:220 (+),score=39.68 TRINITY_DN4438_c0_g1_i2:58-660(+)
MAKLQGRRSAKALLMVAAGAATLLARTPGFVAPSGQPSDVQRRDVLRTLGLGAATALTAEVLSPSAALAGGARWSGEYQDPKHPGCERKITKENENYVLYGTSSKDGSKDCKPGEPVKKWALEAKPAGIDPSDPWAGPPKELMIDFSAKGGPKDAIATWDKNGIIFPDGNRWKKLTRKPGSQGTYSDAVATPGDPFSRSR